MTESDETPSPAMTPSASPAYIHPRRDPFEHRLLPIPKLIFTDGTQTLGPIKDKLFYMRLLPKGHKDSAAVADVWPSISAFDGFLSALSPLQIDAMHTQANFIGDKAGKGTGTSRQDKGGWDGIGMPLTKIQPDPG
ncbi:hypothetical protein H5410_015693 [Solanum commersonii]|uniref:Uncharacterized protein n=1 Tax=Solanum commersonii TaxID=4109 RepID=A0A9J5ZU78_SOLCO|nr:hypothetical protein H5410_015693 [Solanum commersonii]